MQLSNILDENSKSAIIKKTNISEDNIMALENGEFDKIIRVKAMGFISILEREYRVDLTKLREDADAYYSEHERNEGVTLGMPIVEEKKGKSKFFMFVILFLIGFAIWYAYTNLDKEKLAAILPFSEETLSKLIMPKSTENTDEKSVLKELSIEKITVPVTSNDEVNTSE